MSEIGKWLDTIEWGSAAEWVSGLFTAGALVFAVILWRGDRRRSRRALADGFATWQVFMGTHAVKDKANFTVEVHAYNAGDRPIPFTMLMVKPGSPQHALQTMGTKPIPPQSEIIGSVGFENLWYDSPLLLMFRDGNGQTWLRDLASNKYVRKRQVNKWYRQYGRTELGMYHFLFTNRNRELIQKTTEENIRKWNAEHPGSPDKRKRSRKNA